MKKITKVFEYLVYAVLVFMAFLVIASALPIPGGIKTFVVLSGSMEPAIKTGSVVIVLPRKNYNVDDVITFGSVAKGHISTTHRIIEEKGQVGREVYTTKGDANEDPDLRGARQREVIGKVLFSLPYLGYIVAMAKKPLGFGLIIGIPALLFVIDQVHRIFKEAEKIKKNKDSDANLGLPEDMRPGKGEKDKPSENLQGDLGGQGKDESDKR